MSGMTQELLISENNETGYRDQFQIVVRKIGPEKKRVLVTTELYTDPKEQRDLGDMRKRI